MRLLERLTAPRADVIAIALATLLLLPSLTTGYAVDDHLHRVVLRDETLIAGFAPTKLDLFTFADGDPDHMRQLMDRGVFPWTTEPTLQLAFLRPLSALTHLVDDALWPNAPALAHAQNIAWFVLLLVLLSRLYRRIQAVPWVAGLALLLYAIDDAHAPTIGWIANRQSIIAAVFGVAALLAHRRWRLGWRPGAVVGPALLALSLLAGESGLASAGYLLAYTLTLDTAPKRLRALAPYGLVLFAWGLAYVTLGYGARGSGLYVEPLADPLGFASALVTHLPVLLAAQFGGIWSEIYAGLAGSAAHIFVAIGAVYCLLLLDVLKVTLKVSREARFWALGTLFAALPICSTVPSDRLLIFVGVGAAGLIASFIHAPEGVPGQRSPSRVRRVSVTLWIGGLVLSNLVSAPIFMPLRAQSMQTIADSLARADHTIPADANVTDKIVIAVNPPADPYLAYIPIIRASLGRPSPHQIRWLAVGQSDVTVTRESAASLVVTPHDGYLQMATEQLVRDPDNRFAIGQRVTLDGAQVEVLALTRDGLPQTTRWRFDRPLDASSFVWLAWSDATIGFVPFPVPPIGATVTLPKIDALRAFLGE